MPLRTLLRIFVLLQNLNAFLSIASALFAKNRGCTRIAFLRLHRAQTESFRQLTHFGKCADLSFQSLIVLPLDLKFGLQLFDQQVQVGNLHAEFLNI